MLTDRMLQIFKCIVDDFVKTAEPVGSKTLMEKYLLPYSSATIRNDMVTLEELGYLEKTHTSSGRVPSIKGYRFYCEHLMENQIDKKVEYEITQVFNGSSFNLDDVIKESCDILSRMVNLTAGALGPDSSLETLEHVKLFPIDETSAVCVFITNSGHTENRLFNFDHNISLQDVQTCCEVLNDRLKGTKLTEAVNKLELLRPILAEKVTKYELLFNVFMKAFVKFASDNVYFSGQSNMLYQPEFADVEKLKNLMSLLDQENGWRDLSLASSKFALDTMKGTKLVWLDDLAVISSPFVVDDQMGQLMVVGPPRMDYDKIVGLLEYISETIERTYRSK